MTEYEIADLAAFKAFELQGMLSLLQVQMGTNGDGIQVFISILFGFPAAAYFIGAGLKRRQILVFSALCRFRNKQPRSRPAVLVSAIKVRS